MLHVGTPGGPTVTVADDRAWDHGLRTEIVGAVLRSLDDPAVGLGHPGRSAGRSRTSTPPGSRPRSPPLRSAGRDPAFVVVTRHGWRDPRSGAGQRVAADPAALTADAQSQVWTGSLLCIRSRYSSSVARRAS